MTLSELNLDRLNTQIIIHSQNVTKSIGLKS